MSKTTKIWLIAAFFLVLVGSIIFGGVMSRLEWDFTKLSTIKYETNKYEITENYRNISITTDTASIVFVPSENQKTAVVCHEQKNMKHAVTVQDGALVIEVVDTRNWYEYIGINFGEPKITVYIPQGEYGELLVIGETGDVEIPKDFTFGSMDIRQSTGEVTNYASASGTIKIKTSAGNIYAKNISAATLELSVSTGRVVAADITCSDDVKISVTTGKTEVSNISCKNAVSSGSTGDIFLMNLIATEKVVLERSTGDIKFDGCDAAEISVKTETGSVKGNLLSDKVFITETDTGRIHVPKTATGGRCEITTDTGDISIEIQK